MPRFRSAAVAACAALLMLTALPAWAVAPDATIVVKGGGWGHGIGMPQYGALGFANDGKTFDQILAYYYSGTGLGDLSATGITLPDPLRIGTTVTYGSPVSFTVSGSGTVEVCFDGEASGSCSGSATTGATWAVAISGSDCALTNNGTQAATGPCPVTLRWTDQPGTRVAVPATARTFARGALEFSVVGSKLRVVALLGLEEYMYGMAEVPPSWPPEALKAQAVASRTFAVATVARRMSAYPPDGVRADCGCNLVWTTGDQAYLGWSTRTEGDPTHGADWVDAVDKTAGKLVVYPKGSTSVAETYYFSSSGGGTENVSDIWGSSQATYPYLSAVKDPYPTHWSKGFTGATFTSALNAYAKGHGGHVFDSIVSVKIAATYQSGSPSDIVVKGVVNGAVAEDHYTGRAFKAALGLRSHYVTAIQGMGEVDRLAGADRYGTAAAVSAWAFPKGADVVYVATGENFPDALAGGPAAAAQGAPILLLRYGSIPSATQKELTRLHPSKIVVLGGTGVVSAAVAKQLAGYASSVVRLAGPTRYDTAVAVSQAAFPKGAGVVYVATGTDFPDALVAAPAAGQAKGPLLLIRPDFVMGAVQKELARLKPDKIVVVGASITAATLSVLRGYASTVEQVTGSDRYATAADLSSGTFGSGVPVAYVAVGSNFPDALAGGAAAGVTPGPILLVQTDGVPGTVTTELKRIQPERIVVLGGTGVVSAAVADQLAAYAG